MMSRAKAEVVGIISCNNSTTPPSALTAEPDGLAFDGLRVFLPRTLQRCSCKVSIPPRCADNAPWDAVSGGGRFQLANAPQNVEIVHTDVKCVSNRIAAKVPV
jgi:hypothetical protein